MSVTVERLSSNQLKLNFVVSPEDFEKGVQQAYVQESRKISLPGFRKGKAPRRVIEMHYGADVFYDAAIECIFPELYGTAVQENDLHPVDRPEVKVDEIEKGKEVKLTATVYVRPEVTLGDYTAITAERAPIDITDDDVAAEVTRARERVARFVDVTDRPAALDDQVNIDYAGTVDGVAFEGGTAQGHDLVLGSGQFIPGFEDQLVGAQVGEERDVNVTFPEAYHAEALAGKPAVFHVKVNAIQQKELPELDDDFAKDISEFDTLDEYKADVRGKLIKEAEERANTAFENEVIEQAVAACEADIPAVMIESEVDTMVDDLANRFARQGIRLEDYLMYSGQSIDALRNSYREVAATRVKTDLAIAAIAKAQNIEATDAEMDAEIQAFADQTHSTLEETKARLSAETQSVFRNIVINRKTLEFLKGCAK